MRRSGPSQARANPGSAYSLFNNQKKMLKKLTKLAYATASDKFPRAYLKLDPVRIVTLGP
jgi:hypothetical protein